MVGNITSVWYDAIWFDGIVQATVTMLGIMLGVPAALWVNTRLERMREKNQRAAVLRILHQSLTKNLQRIAEVRAELSKKQAARIIQFDTTWWEVYVGPRLEALTDAEILEATGRLYVTMGELNMEVRIWCESAHAPLSRAMSRAATFDAAQRSGIQNLLDMAEQQTRTALDVVGSRVSPAS